MHQKIAQILLYATYAIMQPFWLAPQGLTAAPTLSVNPVQAESTCRPKGHKSMWLSGGSQKGRQQLGDVD